jgi:hypothetical protein
VHTPDDVMAGLTAIGVHPWAPFRVTRVLHDGDTLYVELAFTMRAATPVCCPELGCYVRFLGARRRDVPAVLGVSRVQIRASGTYEDGYRFTGLDLPPRDNEVICNVEHFA